MGGWEIFKYLTKIQGYKIRQKIPHLLMIQNKLKITKRSLFLQIFNWHPFRFSYLKKINTAAYFTPGETTFLLMYRVCKKYFEWI